MEQLEFQQKVMKALSDQQSILKRMTNYNQCLQALCLALAEQEGLDRQKLEADYEANLLRVQEQMPPHHQDPETYRTFEEALRSRLRPSRG